MLLLGIILHVFLAYSAADYKLTKLGRTDLRGIKDGTAKSMLTRGLHEKNRTYFNREENLIRVPNKIIDTPHKSLKTMKSPKRTIQKIIKKRKNKGKKAYAIKSQTVTIPPRIEESREEFTTEELMHRRRNGKVRKSPKIVRNKIFHFQTHKRNKRDARELYILKDFDEMEFVKSKKDYDQINAHVKKYW